MAQKKKISAQQQEQINRIVKDAVKKVRNAVTTIGAKNVGNSVKKIANEISDKKQQGTKVIGVEGPRGIVTKKPQNAVPPKQNAVTSGKASAKIGVDPKSTSNTKVGSSASSYSVPVSSMTSNFDVSTGKIVGAEEPKKEEKSGIAWDEIYKATSSPFQYIAELSEKYQKKKDNQDWANYQNVIGVGKQTGFDVTSDGEEIERDTVNQLFDNEADKLQQEAIQNFNDGNEERERLMQEAQAVGTIPEEWLELESGQEAYAKAVNAAAGANAMTENHLERQAQVIDVERDKTTYSDNNKMEDLQKELKIAGGEEKLYSGTVYHGRINDENKYYEKFNSAGEVAKIMRGDDEKAKQAVALFAGQRLIPIEVDKELFLTEKEMENINWFYGSGQPQKAEQYYKLIERELNQRRTETLLGKKQNFFQENDTPVTRIIAGLDHIEKSTVGEFGMVGETIGQAVNNHISGEYRDVDMYGVSGSRLKDADVDYDFVVKDLSPEAKIVVDLLLSTGKAIPEIAANAIPVVGPAVAAVMAGTSSAGRTMYDVGEGGGNTNQMIQAATLGAAKDVLTYKLGKTSLFEAATGGKQTFIAKIGRALEEEGMKLPEKSLDYFADVWIDRVTMGDKSEYELYKKELEKQGMSEDMAKKMADEEFFTKRFLHEMGYGSLKNIGSRPYKGIVKDVIGS